MKVRLLIPVLTAFALSCNRKESTVPNPAADTASIAQPTFTCSGSFTVFEDLQFDTANIPPGSMLVWDFGDDSTSTDFTPKHGYASRGHFTVTLKVITDTERVVSKDVLINVNAERFAGPRHWVFTEITATLMNSTYHFKQTYYNADTVVELSALNDSTLTFGNNGDNLLFTSLPNYRNPNYVEFFPHTNPSGHTYLKYEISSGKFNYRTLKQSDANTLKYFYSK